MKLAARARRGVSVVYRCLSRYDCGGVRRRVMVLSKRGILASSTTTAFSSGNPAMPNIRAPEIFPIGMRSHGRAFVVATSKPWADFGLGD